MPWGERGATSSGFLALWLVVSLPGKADWSWGGREEVGVLPEFPSGCLRLASTEGLPLWRWSLCPLSLPHLCLLATASFSSPQDEGRSGSLAFTSLGCTCGFHMSLPCLCLKTKHHRVWHPPQVILIGVSSTPQGSWPIVSLLKQQSAFRSREGTCHLKLNLRAVGP